MQIMILLIKYEFTFSSLADLSRLYVSLCNELISRKYLEYLDDIFSTNSVSLLCDV